MNVLQLASVWLSTNVREKETKPSARHYRYDEYMERCFRCIGSRSAASTPSLGTRFATSKIDERDRNTHIYRLCFLAPQFALCICSLSSSMLLVYVQFSVCAIAYTHVRLFRGLRFDGFVHTGAGTVGAVRGYRSLKRRAKKRQNQGELIERRGGCTVH